MLAFSILPLLPAETSNPVSASATTSPTPQTVVVNGPDTLTYANGEFFLDEEIRLEENASLIVQNAVLVFTSSSRSIIQAYGNSTVQIQNSIILHELGYS